MSHNANPESNPSEFNPFEPPTDVEQPTVRLLGPGYWLPIIALDAFSIALLLTEAAPIGWFGLATTVFAAYHGFIYQNRVAQRAMAGEPVSPISNLALSAFSLFLGAAASIAGSIAFVGTCFPAGFMVVETTRNGNPALGWVLMSAVWGICGLLALYIVGALLRLFVPRKPSK